jgi:hypothetical protein
MATLISFDWMAYLKEGHFEVFPYPQAENIRRTFNENEHVEPRRSVGCPFLVAFFPDLVTHRHPAANHAP